MSENKLKNFLVNGFQNPEPRNDDAEETVSEEETVDDVTDDTVYEKEYVADPETAASLEKMNEELTAMREMLEEIRSAQQVPAEQPDMSRYLTNKEQLKAVTAAVERKDADSANRVMVRAMEQISVMREDFFKLCTSMRERIDRMSAADVLSSFEAYTVDMENILTDGGVQIGQFPYETLNTLHHRIVDVVPTDDPELDGRIAERLSDGYKIGSKVLLKEKVKIYKFVKAPSDGTEGETASETVSIDSADKATETQEDKE